MSIKKSANEIYQKILPYILADAGQPISIPNNPDDQKIIELIKPMVAEDYQELVEDVTDRDVQGSLKVKLRRLLKGNKDLQQTISILLIEDKGEATKQVSNNLSNNKNAFIDATIKSGRDLNIGDKILNKTEQNTIDKQTNIDKIEGNEKVHIGDIINIYEMTKKEHTEKQEITEITKKANQLIAKNKIKRALELLLANSKNLDEDIYKHIVQQSQRWNKLKSDEIAGTIGTNKARIISNRITYGLLEIIKELDDLDT